VTATRTVVLVPRRDGQPDRDALWAWCRDWWSRHFPDWPIVEGHHPAGDGLFNRSLAINRAARNAGEWDAAVIIDSDVICDPARTRAAVERALMTGGMVMPYTVRKDLNRTGSQRVMAGYAGSWERHVARTYRDMVSSVIAVPRPLWEATGGFDEAFVGWGFEDNAFAVLCETFGPPIARIDGDLWHLWHATAPEGKRGTPSHNRNRARAARYLAVRGNAEAVRAIRSEASPAVDTSGAGIPRILHRTVPRETSAQVEAWWDAWQRLHPGWEFRTWRDPIDPARFPLTSPHWHRVRHGAQLADLVRLEALWNEGGVYVDSDVEPYRPLDALLPLSAFAAWEDARRVPNAVIGAAPAHPAIRECIDVAVSRLTAGVEDIPEATGPGVLTTVLPWRADVLLLPPGAFYPYHYTQARTHRARRHDEEQPWAFGAHHWAGSWLPEDKRW
jgi:hypothetical protein